MTLATTPLFDTRQRQGARVGPTPTVTCELASEKIISVIWTSPLFAVLETAARQALRAAGGTLSSIKGWVAAAIGGGCDVPSEVQLASKPNASEIIPVFMMKLVMLFPLFLCLSSLPGRA
jgi:hypothetical protein